MGVEKQKKHLTVEESIAEANFIINLFYELIHLVPYEMNSLSTL